MEDFTMKDRALPSSVQALIRSIHLPLAVADCIRPAGTHFTDIAVAVDDYLTRPYVDPEIHGALALMGAYAHLDACEDLVAQRSDRVRQLLDEALRYGIDAEEAAPLRTRAEQYAGNRSDNG
ncbi:hypothetical protein [Nocardia sp. NBC_00511]|uniref:hypothetical protein n=1 Tax=Nocardia sp. NBC_00511 TaxID=2903591 RepID=UPI0030DF274D